MRDRAGSPHVPRDQFKKRLIRPITGRWLYRRQQEQVRGRSTLSISKISASSSVQIDHSIKGDLNIQAAGLMKLGSSLEVVPFLRAFHSDRSNAGS
jgi:hypothetical protein